MARYRWRRYRRITTLNVPGQNGILLVPEDPRRVALKILNYGTTGDAYVSEEGGVQLANDCDVIPKNNGSWIPGTAPVAPQNEVWGWGDAGHDLRISEILEVGDGYNS